MNKGKIVIVTMLAVGLGLASLAWWVRWSRSQPVLEHWGEVAAVAIRNGEKVELLHLALATSSADERDRLFDPAKPNAARAASTPGVPPTVPTDSMLNLVVTESRDITKTAGLIHARHHLLHQKGFLWDKARDADCVPVWQYAMRFSHGLNHATMLFDFQCNRVYLVERQVEVDMLPIAPAMQTFLTEIANQGKGAD